MSIVICGASGQLGRLVAERVLAAAAPGDVVLVTREPAKLADLAARGAEVRPGDFDVPASLPAAFAGGTRLLVISTDVVGTREAQHRAAIEAAAAVRPELIAYTSVTNPSEANPAFVVPEHRATEALLRASGAPWTVLRNALYAEFQVGTAAGALATGRLVTNAGDGRTPYVARADCAAAAAAVLLGGDEHAGRAYDVCGPDPLDAGQLAGIFAEVGGRPVAVELVSDGQYVDALAGAGIPRAQAALLATLGAAARGGFWEAASDVEALTGVPPEPFAAVLRAHRAELPR
jgi:NAD(P)H dehydrogenase (quinone)